MCEWRNIWESSGVTDMMCTVKSENRKEVMRTKFHDLNDLI